MDYHKHIRNARKHQAEYWDENLDPDNQSGTGESKVDFADELPFYLIPDQRDALNAMGNLQGKLMLEIGAGIGMNARWCQASGADVVAIDIAADRLQMLNSLPPGQLPNAGPVVSPGKLMCVKCKAEALPFRKDAFSLEYVKAVLIHTELEQSLSEMNRVLAPEGLAVIQEPMDANPFVKLYRNTFAPQIWKDITIYFSPGEIAAVGKAFDKTEEHRYYFLSFFAFAFQFAVRIPFLFKFTHAVLGGVDSLLFALFPFLRRYAWFVMITAGKCKK